MTPVLLAINLVWFLTLKLDKKVSLFNGILWFSGFLWDWLISAEVTQPSGEAPFHKSLLSPSAGMVDAPQDFVSAWLSLSPGSLPLFLFPGVGWQQTKAVCSTTLALFSPLKTSQNMLLNFLLPSLNPTFLKGKIRGNGQKNSLAELSSHIIDNYWPCGNKKGRAEKSCVGSMCSKWRSETRFGNRSGKRSIKITGCSWGCWETQGEGDTELTLECREGEEKNKILPWSFICIPVKEKNPWMISQCVFICIFGIRACSQSQNSKSSGSPILLQFTWVQMEVESYLLYSFQKLNLEEDKSKLIHAGTTKQST